MDGEAGIGKTTIWREALAPCGRGATFRVLVARPAEAEADALLRGARRSRRGGVRPRWATELPPPQRRALDVALLSAESGRASRTRERPLMGLLGILSALAARESRGRRRRRRAVARPRVAARARVRSTPPAAARRHPRGSTLPSASGDAPLGLAAVHFADESIERVVARPPFGGRAPSPHPQRARCCSDASGARPDRSRRPAATRSTRSRSRACSRVGRRRADDRASACRSPTTCRSSSRRARARSRPRAQDAALVAAALSRPNRGDGRRGARRAGRGGGCDRRGRGSRDHRRRARADPVLASAAGLGRLLRGFARAAAAAPSSPRRGGLRRRGARTSPRRERDAGGRRDRCGDRAGRRSRRAAGRAGRGRSAVRRRGSPHAGGTPRRRGEAHARRGGRTVRRGRSKRALATWPRRRSRAPTSAIRRAQANVLLSDIAWVENPGRQQVEHLERALGLAGRRSSPLRPDPREVRRSLAARPAQRRSSMRRRRPPCSTRTRIPALLATRALLQALLRSASSVGKAPRGAPGARLAAGGARRPERAAESLPADVVRVDGPARSGESPARLRGALVPRSRRRRLARRASRPARIRRAQLRATGRRPSG